MKVELDLPDGPITPDEFAKMDEPSGWHMELWKGNLLLMSPYTQWHERIKRRIAGMLEARGEVADTERGVVCPDGSVPIADVGVLREEPPDLSRSVHPAADFVRVVEVVSQGSRHNDYEKKPGQYAEAGIPEYWIVDQHPADERDALVQVFRLTPGGEYALTEKVALSELEARA
jgi:Uma2 family endonuclease